MARRSRTAVVAPEPSIRDAERTRPRILAAALREFSAKGISGARVDTIAARSRANKRMLYYYFGSKEGLYRAVLRQRLSESAPGQGGAGAPSPELPPVSGERLVALDVWMASSPEYVRLLMWEALERGDAPDVEEEASRREALGRWVELVAAEQRAGRLPAGIDPAALVCAQLALAMFPYAFPQLARLVTGREPGDPAARAAWVTALGRVGALLAGGRGPSGGA